MKFGSVQTQKSLWLAGRSWRWFLGRCVHELLTKLLSKEFHKMRYWHWLLMCPDPHFVENYSSLDSTQSEKVHENLCCPFCCASSQRNVGYGRYTGQKPQFFLIWWYAWFLTEHRIFFFSSAAYLWCVLSQSPSDGDKKQVWPVCPPACARQKNPWQLKIVKSRKVSRLPWQNL